MQLKAKDYTLTVYVRSYAVDVRRGYVDIRRGTDRHKRTSSLSFPFSRCTADLACGPGNYRGRRKLGFRGVDIFLRVSRKMNDFYEYEKLLVNLFGVGKQQNNK